MKPVKGDLKGASRSTAAVRRSAAPLTLQRADGGRPGANREAGIRKTPKAAMSVLGALFEALGSNG
jgi:hypothetical protein